MEIYINDRVRHPDIKEEMLVVGIRENELELQSKWADTAWYKREKFTKVIPETLPTKIKLSSGKFFDFANPEASAVEVEDIAQGLATEYRFSGQTKVPYSVAQHAVYCSLTVGTPEEQFERLHHDDSESLMKDIAKPLKNLLRDYQSIEANVQKVLNEKFGINYPLSDSCHSVDKKIFEWEYRGLMLHEYEIECWNVEQAKANFLNRHYQLLQDIKNAKERN